MMLCTEIRLRDKCTRINKNGGAGRVKNAKL